MIAGVATGMANVFHMDVVVMRVIWVVVALASVRPRHRRLRDLLAGVPERREPRAVGRAVA